MVSLCVAVSSASSESKTSHSVIWYKGTFSMGEVWIALTVWYFAGVVGEVGVVAVVAVLAGAGWGWLVGVGPVRAKGQPMFNHL